MNKQNNYYFNGDGKQRSDIIHLESPKSPEPYISSPDLIEAVNLSILLNRPLLVEGEAGCGKSRLARAVAYELGLPLRTWPVKSTSSANDGLYSYDAILRLHDIHANQAAKDNAFTKKRNPGDPRDYCKLGPIGEAFNYKESPSVVLIDEIDKADIDFPNDLLTVLDDPWEFEIRETGETIAAGDTNKPIVIITSNKEKGNLPLPFLRRCVYFYMTFPESEERLKEIIEVHNSFNDIDLPDLSAGNADVAIRSFLQLRNDRGLFKKPGTSEFLDWLKVLRSDFYDKEDFEKRIEAKLPFPGVLIKLKGDWAKLALFQDD